MFEVIGPMEVFGQIQNKLQELNITPEEAGLQQLPNNFKSVDEEALSQLEKLIDLLENDEDIVQVYHNLEDTEQ